jgi:hypothetical protein
MSICKASEIPRNEAYMKYAAVTRDEGNAADGLFPTASTTYLLWKELRSLIYFQRPQPGQGPLRTP